MADLQRSVEIIFKGRNQLAGTVSGVEDSLGNISGEAGEASASADRLGDSLEDLDGAPRESVDGLVLALKALVASAALKEFVDANVAIERFTLGVEAVTGSSSRAGDELNFLRESADRLGLNLQSTTTSYLSLLAATEGTALAGADTQKIFEAVAKAMAALGKSSADTDGALQAITQIVSKGTVSMEELRQQLGERLPGAFQVAARSMGLTTEELNNLVATGELTAEEFLPKFAEGLDNAFGNTDRIDSFTGSFNRLQNGITEASLLLGDSGGFAILTKVVDTATASLLGLVGTAGVFIESLGILKTSLTSGISADEFFGRLDDALQKSANLTRGARDAFLDFGQDAEGSLDGAASSADSVSDSVSGIGDTASDSADQLQEIVVTAKRIPQSEIDSFSRALADSAREASRVALELEKLASNERIATIEAGVNINVAGIQADADRAVAIIDTLGESIQATAELLGGLFESRLDADSWEERRIIEQGIRQEQENRTNELAKQNKLIDAQIAKLRAQTDALRNGDGIINIDGAGLQPHLEAFMFEILEALQVRVNAEGYELLLGTG